MGGPSTAPDTDQIARWLRILTDHGGSVEVRSILRKPGARSKVFPPGTDPRRIAEYAWTQSASGNVKAVYFTLNPLPNGWPDGMPAKDGGITHRVWVLIDIDAVRPADASTTEGEKRAARRKADAVKRILTTAGFPKPVSCDSGNNYHLLYRVDLPNNAESDELVKSLLAALDRACSDQHVKIDTAVGNASRICRLYGTLAKKGEHTADRPHRYSRVREMPDPVEPVPEETIRRAIAMLPGPDRNGHPVEGGGLELTAKSGGRPDAESRAILYLARCEPAISGERGHDKTFGVACRVGPGFGLEPDHAFRILRDHYNPRCVPPWTDAELWHKVEDAYESEARRGWLLDADGPGRGEANGRDPEAGGADTTAGDYAGFSDADLGIIHARDVKCRSVSWLWRHRIARGEMTMIAGEGGLGKGLLLAWIASFVTRGLPLPGDDSASAPGRVVFLSAEDDPETTLKPRLVALGVDTGRVTFLRAKAVIRREGRPPLVDFKSLADLGYWRAVLDRLPDTVMLAVDGLPAYLGRGVNDHRNNEVRIVLEPFIGEIVRPRGLAFVGNSHFSKSIAPGTPAHRILGSVAYANLPRNVHAVIRDADDDSLRVFGQVKCNNAPDDLPSFAYRVEAATIEEDGEVIETAKPVFLDGPHETSIRAAMADQAGGGRRGPKPVKVRAIARWVVDYLAAQSRPTRARVLENAAGASGLIGDLNKDGQWSGRSGLYRAFDVVSMLDGKQAGYRIKNTPGTDERGYRCSLYELVPNT